MRSYDLSAVSKQDSHLHLPLESTSPVHEERSKLGLTSEEISTLRLTLLCFGVDSPGEAAENPDTRRRWRPENDSHVRRSLFQSDALLTELSGQKTIVLRMSIRGSMVWWGGRESDSVSPA